MATQRVGTSSGSTALPNGTETALATINVRATANDSPSGLLVRSEVTLTGAASATTCTLTLRYGSGTGGTIVTGANGVTAQQAFQVPASAVSVPLVMSVNDTTGQAGASQYTITGTAAGAAQTAATTVLEVQALEPTL